MPATEFSFHKPFIQGLHVNILKVNKNQLMRNTKKSKFCSSIIFPWRGHVFMQISCITSMFDNKNFICNRFQHLKFSQKVLSVGELMFPPTDGRRRASYSV